MMWAALNDLIQRIITLDKWEQRSNLGERVRSLNLPKESKVLDFGCGTGLFARVFMKMGLNYYGYDIDNRLISYARRLYRNCQFTASKEQLRKEAPFDLILANCCFHHIDSATLREELIGIKRILSENGTFMMIDILFSENDPSLFRKLFRKLELGMHVRVIDDYRRIIEQHFSIIKTDIVRSHLFSIKNNPIYNDLAVFECKAILSGWEIGNVGRGKG
jgi:ubiquinone/menaquinone biosynthesis C-methylase UbiE